MKSLLLTIVFTLWPKLTPASDIKISYNAANELVLSSRECELLEIQHEAICSWKKTIEPGFIKSKTSSPICNRKSAELYSMKVSECLPQFVKLIQHKKNYKNGPNCWGTALSFKNFSKRPRFVWSQEMNYWLESPLCRKLKPGEIKKPGDILNIYGPEFNFSLGEVKSPGENLWETLYPERAAHNFLKRGYTGFHSLLHSETYISDEISFGKNSPSLEDKFQFNKLEEVYGRSQDKECQENQSLDPHFNEYKNTPRTIKRSKCDYFSSTYRCENLTEYFSKQTLSNEEKEVLDSIYAIQENQNNLFPIIISAKLLLSQKHIQSMLKSSDKVSFETLRKLEQVSYDKNHEMLLVLKYFSASGIRKTLELADLIPSSNSSKSL